MKKFILAICAALLIGGCSKNEAFNIIGMLKGSVYAGDEFALRTDSPDGATFSCDNTFCATVSPSGNVRAEHVGRTLITADNGKFSTSVVLTVSPKSNLYEEPQLDFGMNRSELIAMYGDPDAESGSTVGWLNQLGETTFGPVCTFDSFECLKSYSVMVMPQSFDELLDFLGERYEYFPAIDMGSGILGVYADGLTTDTAGLAVALVYNSSYYMVMYMPFSSTKSLFSIDYMSELSNISDEFLAFL